MSTRFREMESDSKRSYTYRLILIIAVVAVVLRIAGILLRLDGIDWHAFEFGRIAKNIISGAGFSYDFYGRYPNAATAWMAPFYPYLLAAYHFLMGENLLGMAIIQSVVGGIVCWVIGVIGVALSSNVVGIVAAGIFALYPEAIFYPQRFVSEPWLLLWMVLVVLCGVKYIKSEKQRFVIVAGILCGLASLTKTSAMVWPLGLVLWILLRKKFSRKIMIDSMLIIVLTGLVILPWTIRNYTALGAFIPVRTNFWFNVWRGNNPYATGTPRNFNKEGIERTMPGEYLETVDSQLTKNEVQRESVYRKLALQYIKENPLRFIRVSLIRIYYFWTRDPTHPLTGHILYWLPWYILLIFTMVGIISVRSRWQDYSFWYVLFIVTTLVFGLTLILPRYRIPLLPGLILLAAEGVRALVKLEFRRFITRFE